MALHLIIDGYNLIRQSPELQELDARELEAGRAAWSSFLIPSPPMGERVRVRGN